VSALLTLNAPQTAGEEITQTIFDSVQWWHIALGIVFGAVVGITQIVPGMSASAFLMAVGWFHSVVSSVSLTYWQQNPAVFLVYLALGVGFLFGVFGFSNATVFDILSTYVTDETFCDATGATDASAKAPPTKKQKIPTTKKRIFFLLELILILYHKNNIVSNKKDI
jgi:uncharacterized membrane protein